MQEFTDKHIALFKQIETDLGKTNPDQYKVERMLKKKGVPHNTAVRMAMDFVDWKKDQMQESLADHSIEGTLAKVLGLDVGEVSKTLEKIKMPLGDYTQLTMVLDNDGKPTDMEDLKDFIFGNPEYADAFGKFLTEPNQQAQIAEEEKMTKQRDFNAAARGTGRFKNEPHGGTKKAIRKQERKKVKQKLKNANVEETLIGKDPTGETRYTPPGTMDQGTGVGSYGKQAKSGKSGQPGNFGESTMNLKTMTESQISRMMVEMPKADRRIFEAVRNMPLARLMKEHAKLRGFSTAGSVEQDLGKREMQQAVFESFISGSQRNEMNDRFMEYYLDGVDYDEAVARVADEFGIKGEDVQSVVDSETDFDLEENMNPMELKKHGEELQKQLKSGQDIKGSVVDDKTNKSSEQTITAVAKDPSNPNKTMATVTDERGQSTIVDAEKVTQVAEGAGVAYDTYALQDAFRSAAEEASANGEQDYRFFYEDMADRLNQSYPDGDVDMATLLEIANEPALREIGVDVYAALGMALDGAGLDGMFDEQHDNSDQEMDWAEHDRIMELAGLGESKLDDILRMDKEHAKFKKEEKKEQKRLAALDKSNKAVGLSEDDIEERSLTKPELAKREEIVKAIKDKPGIENPYAVATAQAKKVAEDRWDDEDEYEEDDRESKAMRLKNRRDMRRMKSDTQDPEKDEMARIFELANLNRK